MFHPKSSESFRFCAVAPTAFLLACVVVTSGCEPVGPQNTCGAANGLTTRCGPPTLEIIGTYDSEWGSIHEITEDAWDDAAIVSFDNDTRTVLLKNPENDPWNPGKYARHVWTPAEGGGFWYCTAAHGKDTEAEANEGEAPDSSDPASGGCGEFPWSLLTPRDPIAVAGGWSSEWADETISSRRWAAASIVSFDNEKRVAILQNPPDDEWNPNLFARVEWTAVEDDAFWYCTAAFGKETADEARDAVAEVDASDPENGGCNDFPWTRLTRK